jgi:hypothetical protein
MVYQLAINEYGRSKSIIEQLRHLPDYRERVERLRDIGLDILGESVPEKATYLLAAISDFLRISLLHLKRYYITNLVKGLAEDDVTQSILSLATAVRDCDLAVSQQIEGILLKQQQKKEREEVLEWLSKENFKENQHDIRSRRLKNTGQWLLDNPDFQKWLNEDLSILWCEGLGNVSYSC